MTLIYLGIAWLAGVFLSSLLNLPALFLALVGLVPLVSLVLWHENPRVRPASVCALAIIEKVAARDRQKALVLRLQLEGGLRIHEALTLCLDKVNLREGTVEVKGKGRACSQGAPSGLISAVRAPFGPQLCLPAYPCLPAGGPG